MRNTTYYLIIALALLFFTGGLPCTAVAEISWDDDNLPFDEFLFAVQKNGGAFVHGPTEYWRDSSDTAECTYRFTQGKTDPYSCVANGDLQEFTSPPGDIRLKAMAQGPDGGVSPPNGLKVQGYLETIPNALTMDHGLNTEQSVTAWVNRRFSVDQEDIYSLYAALSGTVNFDAYNNDSNDQAVYGVEGTVTLEEIVDDTLFLTMPGFPQSLSQSDPTLLKSVRLKPRTDAGETVTYRLKITLSLESKIVNFSAQPFTIHRAVNGTYRLGSQASPFMLEATVNPKQKGATSSWMNLLLSD